MRGLKIILTFLISSATAVAWAQEPVFSQYYSSSLYLNPALAGIEKQVTFGANYRSQWNKLVLPFNTFQLSFVQPVFQRSARKKHLGGAGISVLNDTAGPSREFSSQAVSLSGAYNLYFGEAHTLSMAIQAGASQQKVNYDNLRWTSQYGVDTGYDATRAGESSFVNARVFQPLLGMGAMWSYNNSSHKGTTYYQGVALSNLLRARSHFAGLAGEAAPVFKAHGGLTIQLNDLLEISPNYLFQKQGSNRQFNAGLYGGYSLPKSPLGNAKATLGTWYRFGDAFIVSTGLSTERVSVAFSFDSNVGSMGRTFGNASAYELSMSYRLPGKNNFKRISSPLI
jgi:type IX secretion system PorP/SprF family membrane protein